MTIGLVVVAAGSGTRFGGPKQFADLGGKPLLQWCLEAFDSHDNFAGRVVVLRRDLIDSPEWKTIAAKLANRVTVVSGGQTRAESVRKGLEVLVTECAVIAVHDGARPFPPIGAMMDCVRRLDENPNLMGATVAAPVTDSLLHVSAESGEILKPVDREAMRRAETPQVSRSNELHTALTASSGKVSTDDMQALHLCGWRTAAVTHDGFNPKVTTPEDLAILNAYVAENGSTFKP